MVWASWNLACGVQFGLNRCVRFQSAKKPPTAVNAATEVSSNRPLQVRSIPPPVEGKRFSAAIFPRPAIAYSETRGCGLCSPHGAPPSERRTGATEATLGGGTRGPCHAKPPRAQGG